MLVRTGGEPVAMAAWTAAADGVTEIVGVGTLPDFRRRGFGPLATAHTVDICGTRRRRRATVADPGR